MSKRKRIRDLGLIQFDRQLRPEKRVSYDEYNTDEGPNPWSACAAPMVRRRYRRFGMSASSASPPSG